MLHVFFLFVCHHICQMHIEREIFCFGSFENFNNNIQWFHVIVNLLNRIWQINNSKIAHREIICKHVFLSLFQLLFPPFSIWCSLVYFVFFFFSLFCSFRFNRIDRIISCTLFFYCKLNTFHLHISNNVFVLFFLLSSLLIDRWHVILIFGLLSDENY